MNASTLSPEINPPEWPLRFVHRFKGGIKATATVSESGSFAVKWEPRMPTREQFSKIEREYLRWRTEFMTTHHAKTGKNILILDL